MEAGPDSCYVCGGTDTKLIDGFYYCIECGTQNTNVRETILEDKALGDGTFAIKNKKKIVTVHKQGIEMSGEWYKWHTYNFIICGLADELISLGAKPSFKMKLLWIWTRYMKKYQNKSELIMHKTINDDNDPTAFATFMDEGDPNNEPEEETQEEMPEELPSSFSKKKYAHDIIKDSRREIKFLSRPVILAMLYLALNLDESEIQLSHLYRFIKEKQLDIINIKRFIPDDINVKKIPGWLNFIWSKLCAAHYLRALVVTLLKQLDLGAPKVPDLKKMVDNFLTELCLPNDIKPLVYSLMHFRKCDFLDIGKPKKVRLPDYEVVVMSYILVAIKICFGLDCDYELKISTAVEKINVNKDLPKSYRIGRYSEPSDRLFSFREWCKYMQFRKVMLSKYNLSIAENNYFDIDDYLYMEQMENRPANKEELPDKISMEVISRLPLEHPVGVIPKEAFVPTLTPMTEYTDVIIDYCQDPEVKLLLAEDFKRYSLKYACENLNLLDLNMDNLIKGVSADKKIKGDLVLGTIVIKKAKTQMVYVKNCENRNWLVTNPPTMEHVISLEHENEDNDKVSDHGYDSENTSKEKDDDIAIDKTIINERTTNEMGKDSESANDMARQEIITEEGENKNIFDDYFEDLDLKEECEKNNIDECDMNDIEYDSQIENNDLPEEDFDRRSDSSDDLFNPTFNPETFDRDRTIKELILCACRKYRIAVPAEYRTTEPRKRKENRFGIDDSAPAKRSRKAQYEGKVTVKELLSNYYNCVQSDFVTKVQQETNIAIRKAWLENKNIDYNNDLQISVVERNSMTENRPNTPIERNSAIEPFDEQNPDEDVTNKTNTDDLQICKETDENIENTLFDEDEEMKLEDLVPKGDPEFDEKKYEIDQLYLKVKDEQDEILFDPKDDPEINEIILKKIEESKHEVKSAMLKKDIRKEETSDSEDEVPLSVLKDKVMLMEEEEKEKICQEENFERLIKKDVPEFKYWIRHYDRTFLLRSTDLHTTFDEELKENAPTSFHFVLQECASILNCSNFHLYRNMQFLESYLVCKSKNSTYTVSRYKKILSDSFN